MATNWLPQGTSAIPEYFSMNGRMKALIINVETDRPGSANDTIVVPQILQKCGVVVQVCTDLSAEGIRKEIEDFKTSLNGDIECCWVFVMSHGNYGDVFYDKEGKPLCFKIEIEDKFSTDNCSALTGKPKIIFADFCRGSIIGTGSVSNSVETMPAVTNKLVTPTSDMLVYYAAPAGHVTWRDKLSGNWLIQCFCDVVKTLGLQKKDMELMEIITQTNHNIMGDEAQYTLVKTGVDCQGNDEFTKIPHITQVPELRGCGIRHRVFLNYCSSDGDDLKEQLSTRAASSELTIQPGENKKPPTTVKHVKVASTLVDDIQIGNDRETFYQHFNVQVRYVQHLISNVRAGNDMYLTYIQRILEVWISGKGKAATVGELLRILKDAGYINAADAIVETFADPNTQIVF